MLEKKEAVDSVTNFIKEVEEITKEWKREFEESRDFMVCPWFRGQGCDASLLPSIFRQYYNDNDNDSKYCSNDCRDKNKVYQMRYDEFWMTTTFRNRAPFLRNYIEWKRLDRWLFLAQHFGIPTRLLDWTENFLKALFFAVDDYGKHKGLEFKCDKNYPVVWVLHPLKFNKQSKCFNAETHQFDKDLDCFPNSWVDKRENYRGQKVETSPALMRLKLAFYDEKERKKQCKSGDLPEEEFFAKPIAIQANYVDERLLLQESCFTIHGSDERDFESIFQGTVFSEKYFRKIIIDFNAVERIKKELKKRGIEKSSLFPQEKDHNTFLLEGLAKDLKDRFRLDK